MKLAKVFIATATALTPFKNQLDSRKGCLQADLFNEDGDTDVQTPQLSNQTSESSKTKAK